MWHIDYPILDADLRELDDGHVVTRNTDVMLDLLDRHNRALHRNGVSVMPVQDGLTGWREWITSHGRTAANSLDPALRLDIRPDNSLWLRAEREGETVGVIACRAFETDSIYALCRTGRLWHPIHNAMARKDRFVLQDFPDLSGRMIYQGGLRVIAEGEGIGWHLIRMIRWVGYSYFEADASVGCYLANEGHGWDPIHFSGYQAVAPVLEDAEIGDVRQDVLLAGVTRNHSLRQADAERAAVDEPSLRKAGRPVLVN